MEGDGETDRGMEKRVTDKQSTNKQKVQQSDGATVLRLLLTRHHPATTMILMLLYLIMQNYTHTHTNESAAYPFI